jgi:MerR family mercuric resistance operon transcriptional regulator
MPQVTRTPAGYRQYRQYRPEAADRLRFIKRAQDLGFSLEEIAELLALRVRHASACARACACLQR